MRTGYIGTILHFSNKYKFLGGFRDNARGERNFHGQVRIPLIFKMSNNLKKIQQPSKSYRYRQIRKKRDRALELVNVDLLGNTAKICKKISLNV